MLQGQSYRWLWVVTWVLGTGPGSSIGTTNALNLSPLSSPPTPPMNCFHSKRKLIGFVCNWLGFSYVMCILTPFEECCTLKHTLNVFFDNFIEYTHTHTAIWSYDLQVPRLISPDPLNACPSHFHVFFSLSSLLPLFLLITLRVQLEFPAWTWAADSPKEKRLFLAASFQLLIAPQSPFPVRAGIIDWAGLGQVALGAVSQWCHPWLCRVQRQRVRALLPSVPFPCSLNLRVGKDVTQHCSLLPLCLRTLNSLSLCNGFFQINF